MERRVDRIERSIEGNGWPEHRREVQTMLREWGLWRESRGNLRQQVSVLWGINAAIGLGVLAWILKVLLP